MKKTKATPRASRKFLGNGEVRKDGATKRSPRAPVFRHPKTELEAAVQRYVDLFEFAPIAYVSFNRVGRIEEINLSAAQLLAGSRGSLIGRPFALHVTKEDRGVFLNHLLRCRSSYSRVETELHLRKRNGEIILAHLASSPITSSMKEGELLYQTAIVDLTERKRFEEKLQRSEERYRTLFDLVPVAVYVCDADGIIREYNRRAAELWGREPGGNGQRPRFCGSYKIYYPDGRLMPHEECPMARALRGEKLKAEDLEIIIERPDGERRHVIPAPRILTNIHGKITGAINSLFDITERKRAEAAAMRLAAVVQSSHDAVAAKTLNGIITDWNRSAERIFGYKAKEIIGKSVLTLIPKDRQGEEEEILRKIRHGESLDNYETVRRRKDGQLIDVSLTISPIKGPKGEIVGVSKIARDITNQKQTERRLAEQARLLDLTNDAIIVRDPQNRIVYWNRGAEEMYGFSAKEAVGKITHELMRTTHPRNYKSIQKNLERDNRWSGELIHTRKDGKPITVFSRWSLDRDARGRPALILETNTDVTMRKRTEQQRRALYQFAQMQHMATNVGEIHDASLEAILSAMGCHRASILLFEKEKVMRFEAWRGLSERYRKAVEGHSPWEPDAKSPKPICINDVDIANIPKPLKSAIRSEGIRAAAFIPLVSSQKLIGKFMTYYDAPHVFTDDELKLATTIATQVAQAIEHKRDEEALRERERELARELQDQEQLQKISIQLITQQKIETIYTQIVEATAVLLRSDCGSMQMVLPKSGELLLLAQKGFVPGSANGWRRIARNGGTSCAEAFRRGQRVIVPDLERCRFVKENDLIFFRKSGIRSVQSTPLFSRAGELVGMISNYWRNVHEPSKRELRLLDVLARQAADLIEWKRADDEVRESEARMRATVEQATAGVARSDLNGRIVFANQKLCEMLGYTESELIGKTIANVTHPEDSAQNISLFRQLIRDGKPFEMEKRYVRKNGSILWGHVSVSPVRDATGKIKSAVAVAVDVTARKEAEAELQRSNELLERRVRERTRELRTTNAQLESEIQRRKGLEGEILSVSDREQQRLGRELHDGLCQHLTAVAFMTRSIALRLRDHRVIDAADIEKVAELVNTAAVDTRNLSRALHRVDVDAAGLIVALQDLVDREIWRMPCRLEMKPSFQINNDAAAAHLYRIAREAVINANKHAHARQIVVRLERVRKEMVLRVIDDGVGFPKDLKPQQGLGFHIMNYRAELIGGRLEIDSPQTGGTRVSCYLPIHAPGSRKTPNSDQTAGAMRKYSKPPVASDLTL